MPNAISTHQLIAREAVKMLLEDDHLIPAINTGRNDDFAQNIHGYKQGSFVDINVPPRSVVYTGANFAGGGAAPDQIESKVRLNLDTQRHVPLTWTSKEKLLDIADYKERFLRPAMSSLMSSVRADLLARFKDLTPNVVGTWGTVPATRSVYGSARASLERGLAGPKDRTLLFSSDANLALADANATLFNASPEISKTYKEGMVGRFASFDFFEDQSIPLHTNGAGTGYLVNGAAQAGSSLVVDTGTGALTKGSVFTIANVFAVHPITGVSTGVLRQFVVTADYAGGAGSVAIFPAIVATSATVIGTVNAVPADNAAITVFGTASQARRQNLAFEKNAFTAAFAPLPVLASCEGYTATMNGVSVRVMTFGNGQSDTESTRLDVLYGVAATRPDFAVRITE
jgi:P22 coat protein - gene protein 5